MLGLFFQAWALTQRGIDPDELEHLHAAYCVWTGQIPYRDFYEHHAPLTYMVIQPFFWLLGARIEVLWLARGFSWACSLATLGVLYFQGRKLVGQQVALIAVTLLVWSTIFQAKAIEYRPDVPAALLLTITAILVWNRLRETDEKLSRRWKRGALIAVCAGLSTLFTQKAIVPLAGIVLGDWLVQFQRKKTILPRIGFTIAGGIVVCWGITWLAFQSLGAGQDLILSTWIELWRWPVHTSLWEQLRPTLSADLSLWLAGTVEVITFLWLVFRQSDRKNWGSLEALVITTGWCLLSCLWVKVTYAQYHHLWLPWLALVAARRWCVWSETSFDGKAPNRFWLIAGLGLIVGQLGLWGRAWNLGTTGALPHLSGNLPLQVILAILLITLVLVLIGGFVRKQRAWLVASVAILGCWYGVLRNVDVLLWSNKPQLVLITAVDRAAGPNGKVMDGFTGYGALKPHTLYYWWINRFTIPMLPAEYMADLVQRLKADPPAVILDDEGLQALPKPVRDWINTHYKPGEVPPLIIR